MYIFVSATLSTPTGCTCLTSALQHRKGNLSKPKATVNVSEISNTLSSTHVFQGHVTFVTLTNLNVPILERF